MGEAVIIKERLELDIYAELIIYGNAASNELSEIIAGNIEQHWNEPGASVFLQDNWYKVVFSIKGSYQSDLRDIDVYENTNPRLNFFRVEPFAHGNISFVDGLDSNTGYFKLDNLLNNSTTAAHEFGHTLGLPHPQVLDIRGEGIPRIMYPRGTIVDPPYQYDPNAAPRAPGGTMNPFKRKVLLRDIEDLELHKLKFNEYGSAILGDFSSVWHEAHHQ